MTKEQAIEWLMAMATDFVRTLPASARGPVVAHANECFVELTNGPARAQVMQADQEPEKAGGTD
jgi:hypothetical protein